jgi:hypothetical protein
MYKVREQKITELLKQFALAKELYQSKIPKLCKTSRRNIIRQLQILQRVGFIRLDRNVHEKHKMGRGRQVWAIRFTGLIAALDGILDPFNPAYDKEETATDIINSLMKQIAETHRKQWLIFQEWPYLTQNAELRDLLFDGIRRFLGKSQGTLNIDSCLRQVQEEGEEAFNRFQPFRESELETEVTLAALWLDLPFRHSFVPEDLEDSSGHGTDGLWVLAMKNENLRIFINRQFEEKHKEYKHICEFENWLKKKANAN